MTEPCDLSAVEARRLIGLSASSRPSSCWRAALRRIEATNGAVNAIVAMDADAARKRAKEIEQAIGRGDELGLLAGLPIGVKDLQATAGPADDLGLAAVQGQRARPRTNSSVANIRRAGGVDAGQDQHAGIRRRRQHRNRVYGATGNPFDPAKTCGRLVGRLGRGAGARPGAARHRLGPRRQPAHAGGVLRRGRLPALARRGAERRPRRRASSPFCVMGPMGRTRRRRASPAARADGRRTSATRSPPATARASRARLTGADLGTLRVAVSTRSWLCARRQGHRRRLPRARQALRQRVPRGAGARARLRPACTRSSRCCAACSSWPPTASGWRRSRDLLDRNVIDNTERGLKLSLADVSWAHVEQTKLYKRCPRLLPGCGRADLPGGLGVAVPARAAVRRGDRTARRCRPTCAGSPSPTRRPWRSRARRRCPAASITRACRSASR